MGVYRAGDGYLNLAVGNDDMWGRLCRVLGVPELAADPRFAKNQARVANRGALDAVVGERLVARPVAEWVTTLNEAGVACGPIYTVDQVFADPQVRVAGLVHEHAHEAFGPVKVLGLPVALSRTPPTVRTPAPISGADTRDVLSRAGYAADEIQALADAGVVEVGK
jgi:crotonobetainyl-CoA:carnitine CoA-transferase CaiB-like acyl-CoA transferase